ncbi:MAG: DUF1036 domain-containing protein [Azospirillum sp.]|nr:DUF1036 domain-containing protein [Azospirillum sp.]
MTKTRWLVRVAVVAALVAAASSAMMDPAWADKRVALVVGNGNYQNAPRLPNPPRDAQAMAASLRRLGFEVIDGIDLDRDGMVKALRGFGQAVEGADVALVYYAGHGIQVDGRNYLLPVDAKLGREQDLRYEAMPVDSVLDEARPARRLRVVILDACRDNPFGQRMSRSMGSRSTLVGRGFARIDPAESDTLIAYATKADDVAADGSGGNSPYTAALIQHIETPGIEINLMFGKVRDTVRQLTNDRQQPFTYGSLGGEPFYFRSLTPVAAAAVASPQGQAPTGPAAAGPNQPDPVEMAFWDAIKTSANPADYRAYLEAYPAGRFAALARVRAEAPRSATAPAAPAPAPPPLALPPLTPPPPAAAPAPPLAAWVAKPPPPPPPAAAPRPAPPAGSAEATNQDAVGFQLCNRTKLVLDAAYGYQKDDDWVSEGWWELKPEECATVGEAPLQYSKYYYFAAAQEGDRKWAGKYAFCVDDDEFTIVGDQNCRGRGFRKELFMLVEIGDRTSYTVNLTEP